MQEYHSNTIQTQEHANPIDRILEEIETFLRKKFPDINHQYPDKTPTWIALFVGDTRNDITVGTEGIHSDDLSDLILSLMVSSKRAAINRRIYADAKAIEEATGKPAEEHIRNFPVEPKSPDEYLKE